jgi:hypothetical protein
MTTCRSCPARIRWVTTLAGKPMPLDWDPTPDGNVIPVRRHKHPAGVQHRSTAAGMANNALDHAPVPLRPAARRTMTIGRVVRIEGVRGSNPLSSTQDPWPYMQVRGGFWKTRPLEP